MIPQTLEDVLRRVEEGGWYTPPVTLASRQGDDPGGDTPLHTAVVWNCEVSVRILIDAGADLNARGDLGCTPLHDAVSFNQHRIAELLLEAGAEMDSINEMDWTLWNVCKDEAMKDLLLKYWKGPYDLPDGGMRIGF